MAKKVRRACREATVLNGQPATVLVDGGVVVSAIVLDIMEGMIVGVRVVTNPDKLEHLSAQLAVDTGPTGGLGGTGAPLSSARPRQAHPGNR